MTIDEYRSIEKAKVEEAEAALSKVGDEPEFNHIRNIQSRIRSTMREVDIAEALTQLSFLEISCRTLRRELISNRMQIEVLQARLSVE